MFHECVGHTVTVRFLSCASYFWIVYYLDFHFNKVPVGKAQSGRGNVYLTEVCIPG